MGRNNRKRRASHPTAGCASGLSKQPQQHCHRQRLHCKSNNKGDNHQRLRHTIAVESSHHTLAPLKLASPRTGRRPWFTRRPRRGGGARPFSPFPAGPSCEATRHKPAEKSKSEPSQRAARPSRQWPSVGPQNIVTAIGIKPRIMDTAVSNTGDGFLAEFGSVGAATPIGVGRLAGYEKLNDAKRDLWWRRRFR